MKIIHGEVFVKLICNLHKILYKFDDIFLIFYHLNFNIILNEVLLLKKKIFKYIKIYLLIILLIYIL